jgi:hypothetical protein
MNLNVNLSLTEPQETFVFHQAKAPLFVGGFGSGKTEALVTRSLLQKLENPQLNQGYFAPTYDLINLVAFPRYEEILDGWGLISKINKSDKIIKLKGFGSIICRTMDNPSAIVGFEIADAVIDELDTLKPDHARDAFQKIQARCRQKKTGGAQNTYAVGTTPEGFRFVYDRWVTNASDDFQLVRAPTSSNPYLPDDYIKGLESSYPPNLLKAYCEGYFVNLASGNVYPDFDRVLNGTDATIQDNEQLHIGIDFNVNNMSAVVFVIRDGLPLAVDELTKVRDTPAMATLINQRYAGHSIICYPDASGQNASSKSASVTDHQILKDSGFRLAVDSTNPRVRDRVNCVNGVILNANNERRLKVNVQKCPMFTQGLEQQAYDKNGEPDKTSGLDHCNDAGGYVLAKLYPINRRIATMGHHGVGHARH